MYEEIVGSCGLHCATSDPGHSSDPGVGSRCANALGQRTGSVWPEHLELLGPRGVRLSGTMMSDTPRFGTNVPQSSKDDYVVLGSGAFGTPVPPCRARRRGEVLAQPQLVTCGVRFPCRATQQVTARKADHLEEAETLGQRSSSEVANF